MFTQKATIWFLTGFGWWVIIGQWSITLEAAFLCYFLSSALIVPLLLFVAVCVLLFYSPVGVGVLLLLARSMSHQLLELAIGFSSEILHGLEFQCKSNAENPMQEYFVPKARDSQINFSFAWKARMCKCRAEVSWKKATTTLWIRSCREKIFHLKGIDWGTRVWRPPRHF